MIINNIERLKTVAQQTNLKPIKSYSILVYYITYSAMYFLLVEINEMLAKQKGSYFLLCLFICPLDAILYN